MNDRIRLKQKLFTERDKLNLLADCLKLEDIWKILFASEVYPGLKRVNIKTSEIFYDVIIEDSMD